MSEDYFFMKNYKKSDKSGHFEFLLDLEKKSLTIIVKFFRTFSL